MKKIIALLLALTMVFALAACAKQTTETPATETTTTPETTTTEENTTTEETPAAETTEAADLKVGVFYYTFADTYISSVRTALDAQLDSLGVAYQNFDGNNNQTTQNEQIQTALTDGYNLLVVNMVTSGSPDVANEIISMANGTPVIFFNRAIEADGNEGTVLNANATISFIGTDAPEAGHLQGKMVGEYLLANWDTADLNGDGKISYIMFKGDEANQEAIARTKYGVECADEVLTAAGKPALEFYDASNANKYLVDLNGTWSNTASFDYMQTILAQYNEANGNMVELVICNNDDMALGAINALSNAGYNLAGGEGCTVIPVFGVDATDAAKELIANKQMTGSIKQDAEGMADAVATITANLIEGKDKFEGLNENYEVVDGWTVNIPYSVYTGE